MFHAPTSETKQQSDSNRTQAPRADFSAPVPVAPGAVPMRGQLARLHSAYGNQAVLRMLSQSAPAIQARLAVNKPGDGFEQEADRVADRVMRMTVPPPSIQRKCSGCEEEEKVQRKCAGCEEEEKQTGLQRKEAAAGPQFAPLSVQAVLTSPGHPLDAGTRAFMEPRFGHDFSAVRVHTDATAADSARSVNALAYTSGQHVVFGAGQYSPSNVEGQRLLAHELAHVVQQSIWSTPSSAIQRRADTNCTESETPTIENAIILASIDLALALRAMAARPVSDSVKNALYLAFRDDSQATADMVQGGLTTLKSHIASVPFNCVDATADKTCGVDGTLAYSPGGDPKGAVTFCRPAYFATNMSAPAQSEVVTHEISHMYLNTEDRGYFTHVGKLCSETAQPAGYYNPKDRTPGTAGENPEVRLENADSYGCFVYYLSHPQAADLKSTIASYKGEDLAIKPIEDSGPKLYTRSEIPAYHRFGLRGEPENSGFQIRWWLQAGSKVYKMTARGGESVLEFSLIHREVYLPAESAGQLETDKVMKATLYCEILPFSSWSAKFPTSVITRQLDLEVVVGPSPADS